MKAVAALLKQGKTAGNVVPAASVPAASAPEAAATSPADGLLSEEELQSLFAASPSAVTDMHAYTGVHMYGGETTEGLVSRSVDLNTTPQQINYTGSTSQTFSSTSSIIGGMQANASHLVGAAPFGEVAMNGIFLAAPASASSVPVTFQPTQKEILSATQIIETVDSDEVNEFPRKRGRKPSKKR
jgi:hypothetical protein